MDQCNCRKCQPVPGPFPSLYFRKALGTRLVGDIMVTSSEVRHVHEECGCITRGKIKFAQSLPCENLLQI